MAGTIIADYIRADANKISLNVGNTVIASINALGILSNTGSVIVGPNGALGAGALIANTAITGVLNTAQFADASVTAAKLGISGALLQTQVKRSTSLGNSNSTSWVEIGTDYRVNITPRFSTSRILLTYYIPVNSGGPAYSAIAHYRATKIVSGSHTVLSSDGGTFGGNIGNRSSMNMALRQAGTDGNDAACVIITTYDDPGTTATQTYSFQYKCETGGSSTNYFGCSSGNTSSYGWMSPVFIIAQEIAA